MEQNKEENSLIKWMNLHITDEVGAKGLAWIKVDKKMKSYKVELLNL